MTPPIYSVIDGVQREITSIPVVIDGVERELEAVTATVDGVAREVFSVVIPGKELAYIESSGTEYIDTEHMPGSNTKIVLEFYYLESNTGTNHHIASVSYATGPFYAFRTKSDNSCWYVRYATDGLAVVNADSVYGRHTFTRDRNKANMDGGSERVSTDTAFQIGDTLVLCGYKNASTGVVNGFSSIRIYSCRIWENDVLVRDFIPYRLESGEVGLLDKVENRFYGNAGTGEFVGAETEATYFIIASDTYAVDLGMTWREWVESSYNTGGFSIDETFGWIVCGDYLVCPVGEADEVNPDDVIDPTVEYGLYH